MVVLFAPTVSYAGHDPQHHKYESWYDFPKSSGEYRLYVVTSRNNLLLSEVKDKTNKLAKLWERSIKSNGGWPRYFGNPNNLLTNDMTSYESYIRNDCRLASSAGWGGAWPWYEVTIMYCENHALGKIIKQLDYSVKCLEIDHKTGWDGNVCIMDLVNHKPAT